MTIQELQNLGAIYFPNIQDGFELYNHETLTMDSSNAYLYFQNLCKDKNYKGCYVDFYYYTLDDAAKNKIQEVLTEDECLYLEKNSPALSNHADESCFDIIFPLNDTLLQIICKLNATAMLFSTLYFIHPACTYWGNYNSEYIAFKA